MKRKFVYKPHLYYQNSTHFQMNAGNNSQDLNFKNNFILYLTLLSRISSHLFLGYQTQPQPTVCYHLTKTTLALPY